MEYFALFNLLILILFFLSRALTSEIHQFFYQVTRSEKISTYVLAFVFIPGVVIHEISHYLTAKFLLVPTGKISLFPKRDGNYIKLGSVQVAESNILKEFLIGVAPMVVGVIFILSFVYFLLLDTGFTILKIIFSLYAIFVISNTMYASRKDMQAGLPFMVAVITLGIVLFIIGFRFPVISLEWLPRIELPRIFFTGSLYLALPILIDIAVILILRIFDRVW